MADGETLDLLKRYITVLNAEGFSVCAAYLFGSYSNNSANKDSDIDVMIVSDKYDENDDLAIGKMWNLTRKVNSKIEPFLIGTKRFTTEDSSPLVAMIKAKGIALI